MSTTEDDLKAIIREDPANPVFSDLADLLRKKGGHLEALKVCLDGLSLNPKDHKGRLALARIFYDLNHTPFAVREVQELCREFPKSEHLKKLLQKLSPGNIAEPPPVATPSDASNTVAESDFDFDDIEGMEEE